MGKDNTPIILQVLVVVMKLTQTSPFPIEKSRITLVPFSIKHRVGKIMEKQLHQYLNKCRDYELVSDTTSAR